MRLSQKHIFLFIIAAIVITTLVAYEPIRHNGFVNYDDDKYITKNPDVTGGITGQSATWAFTKFHSSNWHPLTWLSHMLDCQLFGLNPSGHHLVSVLIHIVNALLLFWVLNNLTGAIWPSAFVAAVFALHPLQVESVAWAAERKTVLSGLFWLLTMAAYVRYARQPGVSRYLLVLLVFGLCIMTKPVVVTLPFALLLLDYWPLERIGAQKAEDRRQNKATRSPSCIDGLALPKTSMRWLIAEKIPLLAMSVFLSVMTFVSQKQEGSVPTLNMMPLDYRVANMFLSYIRYIGKMLWPSGLAACYPHPHVVLSDAPVVMCMVLFIVLTVLSIYIGWRRRYVAVGWLWYVGTLVPMIGLVQAGVQAIANRYMYLSMVGLLIIITCATKDFIASRLRLKIVAAISAAVLLSTLVILTRIQVSHWQNSITLNGYALKVTKNNALVENNYGTALLEADMLDEAQKHLQNALRISPAYSDARNNLASVYLKKGMLNEAIACFNEIIKRNEATANIYYNLAAALEMQKKYDEAIKYYAKSLEMNPEDPAANKRMGIALLAAGKTNEAIRYAKRACELTGDKDAECLDTLASAFGIQKKYDEAMKYLKKAMELAPDNPDIHNKMGMALLATGRPDEAITHFKYVLQKGATSAETYANLGSAYIQVGKYDLAIENLNKAIELKPDNIDVINKLAWLFAAVDDTSIHNAQKAVEFAQRGCELTGYNDPMLLDTLAVSYATAGRFTEAKATAEKALNIAKSSGREDLAGKIQKRIKLYETGQSYRGK